MSKRNMLIIGIDGACWPLINKLIDSGELPNIKSLKKMELGGI